LIELLEGQDAQEMMRADILALISRNPRCPIAAMIAEALHRAEQSTRSTT